MSWLLLRGLSREKRHWGSFPERLAAATGGERVLCLDLPGFGTEHRRRSPSSVSRIADDVRERFLAERGEERWSVFGVSLGGMIALDWCARHPDDFARCVAVNSSARPSSVLQRFRLAGLRSMVSSLGADPIAKERAVLRLTSNASASKLDALAVEQAPWIRDAPASVTSLASQLRAGMTFRVPAAIRTPVLVLASKADRLVSHRCSEQIANRLGAPLRMHDHGGHDLPLDAPEWICAQISASS